MADPAWERFRSDDPNLRFATLVALGMVDAKGQEVAIPAGRPVAALVVQSRSVSSPEEETTFLVVWQQVAALEGMMRVWRELMPAHLRDQYDARAAEFEHNARGTV